MTFTNNSTNRTKFLNNRSVIRTIYNSGIPFHKSYNTANRSIMVTIISTNRSVKCTVLNQTIGFDITNKSTNKSRFAILNTIDMFRICHIFNIDIFQFGIFNFSKNTIKSRVDIKVFYCMIFSVKFSFEIGKIGVRFPIANWCPFQTI